jgi:pimeloyl-ACP methyl ester carboxylesterase
MQYWSTKTYRLLVSLLAMAGLVVGSSKVLAQSDDPAPISLAREGYLFAGGKYVTVDDHLEMVDQLYAEYQIPSHLTHKFPIVMIPGGGQTGTEFTGTPDGREGWRQYFLRQGYAVYVLDGVGRGRAYYAADMYGPTVQLDVEHYKYKIFSPEKYNLYPQAHLHTQWPFKSEPGESVFDQVVAAAMPGIGDWPEVMTLSRDAIVALLQIIGPAVLLTHSQSGPYGWLVADSHPELVKAIVAVEPNGPPFYDIVEVGPPNWFRDSAFKRRPWGITSIPMNYSPPADASGLVAVQQEKPDNPDVARCWLQAAPAHQLPNLMTVPILLVTSEASFANSYDNCTDKYLEQAGVHPTWMRLGEIGIHGNSHVMTIEMNNLEVAAALYRWLDAAPLDDRVK